MAPLRLPVKPQLFGMKRSKSTQKAITLLESAKIDFHFVDISDISSIDGEMIIALTGQTEIPQLFDGGNSFVGYDQIRRFIGE